MSGDIRIFAEYPFERRSRGVSSNCQPYKFFISLYVNLAFSYDKYWLMYLQQNIGQCFRIFHGKTVIIKGFIFIEKSSFSPIVTHRMKNKQYIKWIKT